jgi:hypothetical protein
MEAEGKKALIWGLFTFLLIVQYSSFSLQSMAKYCMMMEQEEEAIFHWHDNNSRYELKFPNPAKPRRRKQGICGLMKKAKVHYLRNKDEFVAFERNRKNQPNATASACTPALDVLRFITDTVNSHNESSLMMLSYGSLLFYTREHNFIKEDGRFYDDDFDLLISPSALQLLANLESVLWEQFSWTMRVIQNCHSETLIAQIFAACGHRYSTGMADKIRDGDDAIAIELYALMGPITLQNYGNSTIFWDAWTGNKFASKDIAPVKHVAFRGRGTNDQPLHLQIPSNPERQLDCIYMNNWRVPSKQHGMKQANCL